MDTTRSALINTGHFQVTTRDPRRLTLLASYPLSWSNHIKEAFAFKDEECIQELMDNIGLTVSPLEESVKSIHFLFNAY